MMITYNQQVLVPIQCQCQHFSLPRMCKTWWSVRIVNGHREVFAANISRFRVISHNCTQH